MKHVATLTTAAVAAVVTLAACGGPSGGGLYIPITCNNGTLDEGEICDGTLVGDASCQSAGYDYGVLICNATCTNFDYSGCSGGTPADTTGGDDTTTTEPDATTGDSDNVAPRFLSLSSNATTLDAGDQLVVTAVVTDDDGIDDLIGGDLVDAATGGTYGAFATSASEGAYTLTLTWDALNTVASIEAPPTGAARTLRAVFYDAAGASATDELAVTLRCDSGDRWVCDGECADLQTSEAHCGACGAAVTGEYQICEGGAPTCPAGGIYDTLCGDTCVTLEAPATCGSCTQSCVDHAAWNSANAGGCIAGTCVYTYDQLATAFAGGTSCSAECAARDLACIDGYLELSNGNFVELSCAELYVQGRSPVTKGVCNCTLGEVPTTTATTTIAAIQSSAGSVECTEDGDLSVGAPEIVEGVVSVARYSINDSLDALFISDGTQDPFGGMLVRFPSTAPYAPAVGRQVRVSGHHREYYCHTQFSATALVDFAAGSEPTPVPLAKGLTAAELEPYEGMMVSFSGVQITGHTDYNEAQTDAGVLIDDTLLGDNFELPAIGSTISTLQGPLVFSYDNYRVAPRSIFDY